jgi:hypothetical protein
MISGSPLESGPPICASLRPYDEFGEKPGKRITGYAFRLFRRSDSRAAIRAVRDDARDKLFDKFRQRGREQHTAFRSPVAACINHTFAAATVALPYGHRRGLGA